MMKTIKFTQSMLDELLYGDKSETRRPVQCRPESQACTHWSRSNGTFILKDASDPTGGGREEVTCEYGTEGDVLLVLSTDGFVLAKLTITELRIERLQDITEEGAEREGFYQDRCGGGWRGDSARTNFMRAWNHLYWDSPKPSNPWVWVIRFDKEVAQ